MGEFFGCVYTRGADHDTVRRVLLDVARRHQCSFLLAPDIRGWIGIFPSDHGQDAKVSRAISRRLRSEVLHTLVHDGDIFAYLYYRDGRLTDEYSCRPDYFGEVSARKRRALRGKPEELRGLLRDPAQVEALREVLATENGEDAFGADARLEQVAALLGLPNSATSYEYLMEGEDDEVERRDEFVHVPDLGPEQLKRATARAAAITELDRLRSDGRLLFSRSPAPIALCPDPARRGFLSFDRGLPGEGREVYRLAEPWPESPLPTGLVLGPGAGKIAISASGRFLAVGRGYGGWKVGVWDLERNRLLFEVALSTACHVVAFTSDEMTLITADDEIRPYSVPDGSPIRPIPVRCGPSALHPSAPLVACIGGKNVSVVDLTAGTVVRRFFAEDFRDLNFLEQVQRAYMVEAIEQRQRERPAPARRRDETVGERLTADAPRCLAFSRDGRLLFCGTNRGAWVYDWQSLLASTGLYPTAVYRFRPRSTSALFEAADFDAAVLDLAHDPITNRLLLACGDGNIRQMDLATGRESVLLAIPEALPVRSLGFSADGALLYTIESPRLGALHTDIPDDRPDCLRIWDYRKLLVGA